MQRRVEGGGYLLEEEVASQEECKMNRQTALAAGSRTGTLAASFTGGLSDRE